MGNSITNNVERNVERNEVKRVATGVYLITNTYPNAKKYLGKYQVIITINDYEDYVLGYYNTQDEALTRYYSAYWALIEHEKNRVETYHQRLTEVVGKFKPVD
jgi:hypothetical protein